MMYKILCLSLLVAAVAADPVKYEDCGNHEIKSVNVPGCRGSEPCILHRGQPFKIDAKFTANQDSNKVHLDIKAKLDGVEIEVPGVDHNACHFMSCPLKKGQTYDINYTWNVPKIAPKSENVELTIKAVGDNGVLACGKANNLKVRD